jgi:FixJ family two-component response regulator
MRKVVDGCANKVIALDLGVSQRTVELHRARVMHKMGVRSLADLVRMAGQLNDG